mgnify:FL=1
MRELFMCTRHWHPSSYQSSDPRALFREACTVTVGSSTCIWTQRKTNEIPTWRGISLVNQTVLIHWGIYSYSGLSDLLELKKQRSWLLSDYAKALLVHNGHFAQASIYLHVNGIRRALNSLLTHEFHFIEMFLSMQDMWIHHFWTVCSFEVPLSGEIP